MTDSPKIKHPLRLLIFLGVISALNALSIDMGLPAFASMEAALGAAPGSAALTLTTYMAGFFVTPLASGPLADRFGRKTVLLVGLPLFCLGAFASAAAPGFSFVLAARTLQGIGAGLCVVLPVAIIRDLLEGDMARSFQGQVNAVIGLSPLISPMIGDFVMRLSNWRSVYVLQGAAGVIICLVTLFRFRESLAPENRQSLAPARILHNYLTLLKHPGYMSSACILMCAWGALFSYIAGSSPVFIQYFHTSSTGYALIFAVTAGCFIAGSMLCARLSLRGVGTGAQIRFCAVAMLLCAVFSFTLSGFGLAGALLLTAASGFINGCVGMIAPNLLHEALMPVPHIVGAAAGLMRALQMGAATLATALVGALALGRPEATPWAMTGSTLLFTCAAFTGYVFGLIHKKRSAAETVQA